MISRKVEGGEDDEKEEEHLLPRGCVEVEGGGGSWKKRLFSYGGDVYTWAAKEEESK